MYRLATGAGRVLLHGGATAGRVLNNSPLPSDPSAGEEAAAEEEVAEVSEEVGEPGWSELRIESLHEEEDWKGGGEGGVVTPMAAVQVSKATSHCEHAMARS